MSELSKVIQGNFPRRSESGIDGRLEDQTRDAFIRIQGPASFRDIYLARRDAVEALFDLPRAHTQKLTDHTARLCDLLGAPLIILLKDAGAALFTPHGPPQRIWPEPLYSRAHPGADGTCDVQHVADALEQSFHYGGDLEEGVRRALAQD